MTAHADGRSVARDVARRAARVGVTLPELLIALTVAAILASIALSGAARVADSLAVRGAAHELRAGLREARHLAVLRAARAAVRVDTAPPVVTVVVASETSSVRSIGARYGVRVSATRDSVAYAGNGLGWGAANARFVVQRRAAAETITVSRLGRVR